MGQPAANGCGALRPLDERSDCPGAACAVQRRATIEHAVFVVDRYLEVRRHRASGNSGSCRRRLFESQPQGRKQEIQSTERCIGCELTKARGHTESLDDEHDTRQGGLDAADHHEYLTTELASADTDGELKEPGKKSPRAEHQHSTGIPMQGKRDRHAGRGDDADGGVELLSWIGLEPAASLGVKHVRDGVPCRVGDEQRSCEK